MKDTVDIECEKCKQDKTIEEIDEKPKCSREYDTVDCKLTCIHLNQFVSLSCLCYL